MPRLDQKTWISGFQASLPLLSVPHCSPLSLQAHAGYVHLSQTLRSWPRKGVFLLCEIIAGRHPWFFIGIDCQENLYLYLIHTKKVSPPYNLQLSLILTPMTSLAPNTYSPLDAGMSRRAPDYEMDRVIHSTWHVLEQVCIGSLWHLSCSC